MDQAILILEETLEVYTANEQIARKAGNTEQADSNLSFIVSIKKAIDTLKSHA